MKFESLSARETTQQHFGKRGIGWHGFLANYYKLDGTDGVRYTVYSDQICKGQISRMNWQLLPCWRPSSVRSSLNCRLLNM